MNKHLVRRIAAWTSCLGLASAGCRQGTSTAVGTSRTIKLAFVTNNSADFWTIARRGAEKADAELANVETEFRLTSDGTAAEQQRIVDDLLTKKNGPAILNAVREAGKVGNVKIVAFDEADETLAGIAAGAIEATVVQQPDEFGDQAIHKMAQAVRGDRSFVPASKQIIVPTLVVNRGNLEAFTKRNNELRGRTSRGQS